MSHRWVYILNGHTEWESSSVLGLFATEQGALCALYEHETRVAIQRIWHDARWYTGEWVWSYDSYKITKREVQEVVI